MQIRAVYKKEPISQAASKEQERQEFWHQHVLQAQTSHSILGFNFFISHMKKLNKKIFYSIPYLQRSSYVLTTNPESFL